MIRKKKLTPDWVAWAREVIKDQDYLKRRYFHYRILALHCAQIVYDNELSSRQRQIAFKCWNIYTNKADWYYKKINQRESLGK